MNELKERLKALEQKVAAGAGMHEQYLLIIVSRVLDEIRDSKPDRDYFVALCYELDCLLEVYDKHYDADLDVLIELLAISNEWAKLFPSPYDLEADE